MSGCDKSSKPQQGSAPPSSASSKQNPLNYTAAHLLKAAIVEVLGARDTLSIEYSNKEQASISVHYSGDTLSPELLQKIEASANAIITAARPIDSSLIPDVTIEHVSNSSLVKAIAILKTKRRMNKNAYDFDFALGDKAITSLSKGSKFATNTSTNDNNDNASSSSSSSSSSSASAPSGKDEKKSGGSDASKKGKGSKKEAGDDNKSSSVYNGWCPGKKSDVISSTHEAFDSFFIPFLTSLADDEIINKDIKSELTKAAQSDSAVNKKLRLALFDKFQHFLTMFANQHYTKGFHAKEYKAPTMKTILNAQ